MKHQSEPESNPATELLLDNGTTTVEDITNQYPEEYRKKAGITHILNVDTAVNLSTKKGRDEFDAELEALGIPPENVSFSFCG